MGIQRASCSLLCLMWFSCLVHCERSPNLAPLTPPHQVDQLRTELMQERSARQDLECDKISLERQVSWEVGSLGDRPQEAGEMAIGGVGSGM